MALVLEALMVPLSAWFWSTAQTVKRPYLDEVFHVRQVQHYCENRFHVWDPKITTPPGLYILSYIASPLIGCHLTALRSLNAICILLVLLVTVAIYRQGPKRSRTQQLAEHCALNIAFFPPLFFFSALYYTDVASTLSVLLFHFYFLHSYRAGTPISLRGPILVVLGLLSLTFRQTNVFWVAVFPAGLTLVNTVDRGHQAVRDSMERRVEGFGDNVVSLVKSSYKLEVVYDPPVHDAWIEDYIKTILSILACTLKSLTQPRRLLISVLPYLAIIAIFSAFVVWNGSVVLGDKSNHIATLHLPQMLYIWPYLTFFSWPLIYPYLLTLPLGLLVRLPTLAPQEVLLVFRRRHLLPRLWLVGVAIAIAAIVVRVNTIVHPFTLADNRHYIFYVFRLLLRPAWVRYAATPIYIACSWACIQALGVRRQHEGDEQDGSSDKSPSAKKQQHRPLVLPNSGPTRPATVSFVLLWLVTCTLQLVTAPLVEPRYFILPWLFWRMYLPLETPAAPQATTDVRLWLESAWFLTVHTVTGLLFLRRGFEWPQEPGAVQRFMW